MPESRGLLATMLLDMPPDCRPLVEETRVWPDPAAPAFKPFLERLKARMECERLAQAGWSAIETVAQQGRDVRRASFEEGRLAFRVPAVAVERAFDGKVTLSLSIDHPARTYRAALPPAAWAELAGLDSATRTPPPEPKPLKPALGKALPEPIPMGCHGWFMTLEAAEDKQSWRRDAHECKGAADADAMAYGFRLARLAVDTLPQCAAARAGLADKDAPEAALRALIRCAGRFAPKVLS